MVRHAQLTLAVLLASAFPACGQTPGALDPVSVTPDRAVAFVDLAIVPMDQNQVLSRRTVLVRSGRIEWIRDWREPVPADATVIRGDGRYLMPGLIDMHVHARRADMPAYRAAGITTVRNMWGHDGITTLQREIADGTLIGPAIVSLSPGIDGTPVQWPFTRVVENASEAADVVREFRIAGWLALKVYTNLRPAVYDAVVSAARDEGIAVMGHVPVRVSVEHALESGQKSIEHLMGYDRSVSVSGSNGTRGWADADTMRFDRLVTLTVASGTWNCPTLSIYAKLAEGQGAVARERMMRNNRIFVRKLAAAGAGLLAGTDAGIDVVPAGFTLQAELEEFVAAGLTPYRALQSATTDAARFLGLAGIGAVKEGYRADLLLIEGNPLDDISRTRRVSGVMFGGQWAKGGS